MTTQTNSIRPIEQRPFSASRRSGGLRLAKPGNDSESISADKLDIERLPAASLRGLLLSTSPHIRSVQRRAAASELFRRGFDAAPYFKGRR